MKFAALVSGGKDSIYNIKLLMDRGDELVCLIHFYNKDIKEESIKEEDLKEDDLKEEESVKYLKEEESVKYLKEEESVKYLKEEESIKEDDEAFVDSYMYQTVGSEIARLHGKCLNVPIYTYKTKCKAINIDLEYNKAVENDEVEDLYEGVKDALALSKIKFEGLSSGAIESTYQKNRVEFVCKRLNLKSLSLLWKKDQKELLNEMINCGIKAKIVKIASSQFKRNVLGFTLPEVYHEISQNNVSSSRSNIVSNSNTDSISNSNTDSISNGISISNSNTDSITIYNNSISNSNTDSITIYNNSISNSNTDSISNGISNSNSNTDSITIYNNSISNTNSVNSYDYFNYCGEGGEYETCVFDAPFFKKSIKYEKAEVFIHPEDYNKPKDERVYYLKFSGLTLFDKIK